MIALLVVLMLMTILAVTLCGANTYQPGHKFRPEHAQHPPTSFRLELQAVTTSTDLCGLVESRKKLIEPKYSKCLPDFSRVRAA